MDQIVHKFVQVNGLKLHLAEIGSESSPVVVFVHGFPEIWYSWRHQMIAVTNAGYRAIALDIRGYGLSDPPPETEKFKYSDIVNDLLGIIDSLGIDKVPGRAEADFGRLDAKTVVRNIYILFSRSENPIATESQEIMDIVDPSTPLPSWFTEDDLSAYGALYEKSGFLNPLKVPYRSLEEQYDIVDPVIKNPMLLIMGESDYFWKFPGMEGFIKSGMVKHFATDLEIENVPEGSHFVQEQFPDKVNQLIIAFLNKHS